MWKGNERTRSANLAECRAERRPGWVGTCVQSHHGKGTDAPTGSSQQSTRIRCSTGDLPCWRLLMPISQHHFWWPPREAQQWVQPQLTKDGESIWVSKSQDWRRQSPMLHRHFLHSHMLNRALNAYTSYIFLYGSIQWFYIMVPIGFYIWFYIWFHMVLHFLRTRHLRATLRNCDTGEAVSSIARCVGRSVWLPGHSYALLWTKPM